jgi:mRNA-degrading endonuclease RelE of RelBE toxin-antitoxin system
VEYSLVILYHAKPDLEALDVALRARILSRLDWLAKNADQIVHHRLQNVSEELIGLCRFRVGDYRVLYWKQEQPPRLSVYRILHRSVAYRNL